MNPKIITLGKRYIIGKFCYRSKSTEIFNWIKEKRVNNPFEIIDKHECNIMFWKSTPGSKSLNYNAFLGYESDAPFNGRAFTTFEVPACEWAIFEANHSIWWKSGDKDIEGWIANNDIYKWRSYKNAVFQFEYYRDKFDIEVPDSLMEIWYPLERK